MITKEFIMERLMREHYHKAFSPVAEEMNAEFPKLRREMRWSLRSGLLGGQGSSGKEVRRMAELSTALIQLERADRLLCFHRFITHNHPGAGFLFAHELIHQIENVSARNEDTIKRRLESISDVDLHNWHKKQVAALPEWSYLRARLVSNNQCKLSETYSLYDPDLRDSFCRGWVVLSTTIRAELKNITSYYESAGTPPTVEDAEDIYRDIENATQTIGAKSQADAEQYQRGVFDLMITNAPCSRYLTMPLPQGWHRPHPDKQ